MTRVDACTLRLQQSQVAAPGFSGYGTIFESAPVADADARGETIITLDASGGFLLEGISARAEWDSVFPLNLPPQFQIIDTACERALFNGYADNQLFHEVGAYNVMPGFSAAYDEGPSGFSVGRLPRPYYFRPNSSIRIQHANIAASGGHDVYLHGYRYQGSGGPPLPDPRFEPHIIRMRPTYDAASGVARASVQVEQGQKFTMTQICALPTEEVAFSDTQRIQITDSLAGLELFPRPMPMQLFAQPVGPFWRLHHTYTFQPMTTIAVETQDLDVVGLGYGLFLIGWREWLR